MDHTYAYKTLLENLESGHRSALMTLMNVTGIVEKKLYDISMLASAELEAEVTPELKVCFIGNLERGEFAFVQNLDGSGWMLEPFFPEARMVILGGGHIAVPLAEFAAKTGFKVTVVDDRPYFANPLRFPLADQVLCESFEKSLRTLNLNQSAFVVIVTRGHRYDKVCLENVLEHDTAYVGMIGSRRRVAGLKELLISEGADPQRLDQVHTPIGLEIGAVTPEEIAISILAQVIQVKRKSGKVSRKANHWPELDVSVLQALASPDQTQKALVTVVSTKGSVPRREGAKMIVWADGRTLGSIGGGCSEGEAVQMAYEVIRDGKFRYLDIDMTGQVAEDEGMACGGIMKVLIERA